MDKMRGAGWRGFIWGFIPFPFRIQGLRSIAKGKVRCWQVFDEVEHPQVKSGQDNFRMKWIQFEPTARYRKKFWERLAWLLALFDRDLIFDIEESIMNSWTKQTKTELNCVTELWWNANMDANHKIMTWRNKEYNVYSWVTTVQRLLFFWLHFPSRYCCSCRRHFCCRIPSNGFYLICVLIFRFALAKFNSKAIW